MSIVENLQHVLYAISAAAIAWFIAAAVLFFNPLVDRIYRASENHPAVRTLPQAPATIGKILLAITAQVVLWAVVFHFIRPALPADRLRAGLAFACVIGALKIIPRDIDRVLLTTYPMRRMTIEFAIGLVCAIPVGCAFSYVM